MQRAMSKHDTVIIDRLGAQGDGIVEREGGPLFIPEALPGEKWEINDQSFQRVTDSEERQTARCQHFSECGGCVAQHMSPSLYAIWKVQGLKTAFAHRGIDIDIPPLLTVGEGTRRRVTFSFQRRKQQVMLGYHRSASHDVVDVSECPILRPEIFNALPALRAVADCIAVAEKSGRMHVTVVDGGIDVSLEQPGAKMTQEEVSELARVAHRLSAVRLLYNGQPVFEGTPAILTVNDAQVALGDGSFLQASAEAEALIAKLLTHALRRAKMIADLFSGIGTFTFPLAKKSRVDAFESASQSVSALKTAVKSNQGYKPIAVHRRDLFRDPLSARELRVFDAVVINPPRAGAQQQCQRLAASSVKTIAMVACNPSTMARDARALIDGGYQLAKIQPIDQFVYSAHLEIVAIFQKEPPAKRRST